MGKEIEIAGMKVGSGEKKEAWLKIADVGALSVEMPLTLINGSADGPKLVVIAGTHGCEYTGIEASIRLGRDLDPKKIKGSLVIVHVVNVPAFQSRTQYVCPLDGLNFSKIRPGKPDGSISHLILHKLFQEIIFKSNAYMDLHGGDLHEALTIPFIIYPKTPNERTNETVLAMAEAHGIEYIWGVEEDGFIPGGPSSGNPPIPYIIVECGQEGRIEEEYVLIHYRGILNVMKQLGMIEGSDSKGEKREVIRIRRGGKIESTVGGIFYSYVKPSDRVQKDDLLGEIKNIRGDVLERIVAPIDCMILMYVSNPIIGPGEVVFGYAEV
jgi:hypothetical protein